MSEHNPFYAPKGIDLYRCQVKLFWANERNIEAHFLDTPLHATEHTICWLIERGSVTVEDSNDTLYAEAGQWIFLGALEGRQHFTRETRLISMRFDLRWLGGEPVFPRPRTWIFDRTAHPDLEFAARRVIRPLATWGHAGSLLVGRHEIPLADNCEIEGAFYLWLAAYVRAMASFGAPMQRPEDHDSRVLAALRTIETHPMEDKFSLTTLSSTCGLSPNQLGRLFKKETGFTPFEAYEKRRLDLARHALRDTPMMIKEIAYSLGFASSAHFSNWFKEHMGPSPRDFRGENSKV